MNWDLEQIKVLLKEYYPNGHAWEAVVPEAEFDISLNDEPGCQDVKGIAIDLDGDTHADLFLYDRDFMDMVAASWPKLDTYLQPPACFGSSGQESLQCDSRPQNFTPTGFPFSGRTLSNSDGKITSIMFADNSITQGPVGELVKKRPDLQCQILYLDGEEWLRRLTAPSCRKSSFFAYLNRTCDFQPCGGGMWVANEVFVGNNEQGQFFAAAHDERGLNFYVAPLVEDLGALPLQTWEWEDPANMLASSKYLFVASLKDIKPEDLTTQTFASGRQVVPIEMKNIESAAHLDMILTPTEELVNGKPLVFVAKGVPFYSSGAEENALNEVARQLEERGFFIERIPYIYTGGLKTIIITSHQAYSYNNCLMERYVENGKLIKKVYLPWYANYESNNQDAAAVFRKYGYEVIPIHGVEPAAELGGALQCMVKVTGREKLQNFP